MFTNSLLLRLATIAAAYVLSTGCASACGCFQSRSFTMSSDTANVYATATFSFSYLCQGEVTAKITAPDSTTASNDSGVTSTSPVSTTAAYSYGTQDGTYSGIGTFYYDGTDIGYGSGYLQPVQTQNTVAKFVKLTNTTNSKATLERNNDSTTFTVSVLASNNCGGSIQVANGMSGISDLTGITNTPDGGSPVNGTAYKSITVPGGGSANYIFVVATSMNNTASGSLTLSGYLNSYPMGCTMLGPDSPNSASKNVTVR